MALEAEKRVTFREHEYSKIEDHELATNIVFWEKMDKNKSNPRLIFQFGPIKLSLARGCPGPTIPIQWRIQDFPLGAPTH